MQTYVIQHASVFVNGTKVATAHQLVLRISANSEEVWGDAGFLTYTQGAPTCRGEITEIAPVAGTTFSFDKAVIAQQDLTLQWAAVDGSIWNIVMRTLDSEYSSDAMRGTLNRKVTLGGGVPQMTPTQSAA